MLMAVVLVATCTACTTTPGNAEVRSNKVSEQRLAAYAPIRRLTYRDACGSEGALTVCVDRISISDSATLVEARIKNASRQPCFLEDTKAASVLLADGSGMTREWDNAGGMELKAGEERVARFRFEGRFSGEPAIFMVNNVRTKSVNQAGRGLSVVARLGE